MSTILYEIRDRIAYITLNRTDKSNAINAEMNDELFNTFRDVRNNPDVWVAVITGSGRSFSAGGDLLHTEDQDKVPSEQEAPYHLYECIMNIWKPTVAALNGSCIAQGAGIALACDIRIASERAQFGWPQVKRGFSSVSGPVILARMIPHNKALEILYTGDFIDAQEAYRLNMVNTVVPHEQLAAATENFARGILKNAPLAMRAIKEVTIRGHDSSLADHVRLAALAHEALKRSADYQEGINAFREKRDPKWHGR